MSHLPCSHMSHFPCTIEFPCIFEFTSRSPPSLSHALTFQCWNSPPQVALAGANNAPAIVARTTNEVAQGVAAKTAANSAQFAQAANERLALAQVTLTPPFYPTHLPPVLLTPSHTLFNPPHPSPLTPHPYDYVYDYDYDDGPQPSALSPLHPSRLTPHLPSARRFIFSSLGFRPHDYDYDYAYQYDYDYDDDYD